MPRLPVLLLAFLLAGDVALAQKSRSSSSSGRSYSSRPSSSSSSRPSTPSTRPAGKSYSSTPSKPSATPSKPASMPATKTSPPSAGKSYSSSPAPKTAPATSSRPKPGGFDTLPAQAQRRQESRAAFTQGQQPKSTWTDPRGTPKPIDPTDRQVERLRRDLDRERWVSRDQRREVWVNRYTVTRPPVVVTYRDPYSDWFWWWLLTRDLDTRSRWAYHHQATIDQARYRDMLARDAQLEARVRELERQKVARDPAFVPADVDADLMYRDEYVDAAFNPQPAPTPVVVSVPQTPPRRGSVFGSCFAVLVLVGSLGFLVWLVFLKRWGATR